MVRDGVRLGPKPDVRAKSVQSSMIDIDSYNCSVRNFPDAGTSCVAAGITFGIGKLVGRASVARAKADRQDRRRRLAAHRAKRALQRSLDPLDIGREATLLDLAADDGALDLRGAFPDAVDADVAIEPLDRVRRNTRCGLPAA